MRFSEDGICELDSITTADECDAYRDFLWGDEQKRHVAGQDDAELDARMCRRLADRGGNSKWATTYWMAKAALWDSAALRHRQDLDGITKRIKEIEAHRATLEVK